jgi:hypothetical protein
VKSLNNRKNSCLKLELFISRFRKRSLRENQLRRNKNLLRKNKNQLRKKIKKLREKN